MSQKNLKGEIVPTDLQALVLKFDKIPQLVA